MIRHQQKGEKRNPVAYTHKITSKIYNLSHFHKFMEFTHVAQIYLTFYGNMEIKRCTIDNSATKSIQLQNRPQGPHQQAISVGPPLQTTKAKKLQMSLSYILFESSAFALLCFCLLPLIVTLSEPYKHPTIIQLLFIDVSMSLCCISVPQIAAVERAALHRLRKEKKRENKPKQWSASWM